MVAADIPVVERPHVVALIGNVAVQRGHCVQVRRTHAYSSLGIQRLGRAARRELIAARFPPDDDVTRRASSKTSIHGRPPMTSRLAPNRRSALRRRPPNGQQNHAVVTAPRAATSGGPAAGTKRSNRRRGWERLTERTPASTAPTVGECKWPHSAPENAVTGVNNARGRLLMRLGRGGGGARGSRRRHGAGRP